jgi:uroporphyrin-III C-methyltransferase
MKKGKVWLVGAGPGDIGLFTLKGMEVLKAADVVVYDSLVGQGVLAKIPQEARLINVGKRADKHTMPQEGINQLLLEEALKGNRVVRLKGGDPFLFGRGGEELELLTENEIPYEIVPGVTSSIAVPAYNGIPVTHRDFCSSVHIITGHRRAGKKYDIDFKALTDTKGTLVFLMGIAALADICQGLLDAGMDSDMPAAVLQKGTTADQKRVVATVSTLKEEVERQGIETPAIIVVGKVCKLAAEFGWYEKLSLAGCKVLVTRPKGRSSRTADELRRRGAEVLELPSIRTVALDEQTELWQAFDRMDTYQKCITVSMITAGKFNYLIATRISPCRTNCTHDSFCAGIDHTHHLNMRKMFTDKFRHLYFNLCSTSKAQTVCACFNYCFPDLWEVMTEDHRTPGIDIIYVFIAIYIINVTAICTFDKSRSHSDCTIRSDRTVDAARNFFYCTFK